MEQRFERRLDELQMAIADSVAGSHEDIDTRIAGHEQRLTTLEQHFA